MLKLLANIWVQLLSNKKKNKTNEKKAKNTDQKEDYEKYRKMEMEKLFSLFKGATYRARIDSKNKTYPIRE